ncbi:MAG: nitrous oxide reductase accessory protein NosL [Flavobacteriaceae bacterium]|nr:nitrous oxide reductase accessory protein NosL [Flavobacteriaceae bacterium]
MQTLKHNTILFLVLITMSCTVTPKAIDYGNDGCQYCKMTIVDKLHATEIVTNKGKIYKFDATECMINFTDEFDTSEIEYYLTNIYTEPEVLVDATLATFLISENVPSPMGAFLTAFERSADAEKVQQDKGGELYNWNSLLERFKD